MKKFIFKILVWFALKCRLYYIWSKIYQFIYERKYKNTELPFFGSLQKLEETVGDIEWRGDGWRELWDAISSPEATYVKYQLQQKEKIRISTLSSGCSGAPYYLGGPDCDDISLFAANRIKDRGFIAKDNDGTIIAIEFVGLLSCPYIHANGGVSGHNVCIFRYMPLDTGETLWAHMSNWHNGRIHWGFKTKEDVVKYLLALAEADTLGWAIATIDLKLKEYHWNL